MSSTLLMFLILAMTLAWTASADANLGVLIFFALLTTVLGVVSALVAERTAKARKLMDSPRAPRPWRWMSRQQWILLTVGLAAISALTASVSGVRVLSAEPVVTATAPAPDPVPTPARTFAAEPSPTPSASPSPSVSASPSSSASGSPSPSGSPFVEPPPGSRTYLDSVDTVTGSMDASPVSLSSVRYPRSVSLTCSRVTYSIAEWNVAGQRTLAATLGVPDDARYAFGGVIEMLFYDQDGRQLGQRHEVSLGHPKAITVDLSGVVRLRFACSARDSKTNSERAFTGAMGDAVFVR